MEKVKEILVLELGAELKVITRKLAEWNDEAFQEDRPESLNKGVIFQGMDDSKPLVDWNGNLLQNGSCPIHVYYKMLCLLKMLGPKPFVTPEVNVKIPARPDKKEQYKLMTWHFIVHDSIIFHGFADMTFEPLQWFWKASLSSRELRYLYCHLSKTYNFSGW